MTLREKMRAHAWAIMDRTPAIRGLPPLERMVWLSLAGEADHRSGVVTLHGPSARIAVAWLAAVSEADARVALTNLAAAGVVVKRGDTELLLPALTGEGQMKLSKPEAARLNGQRGGRPSRAPKETQPVTQPVTQGITQETQETPELASDNNGLIVYKQKPKNNPSGNPRANPSVKKPPSRAPAQEAPPQRSNPSGSSDSGRDLLSPPPYSPPPSPKREGKALDDPNATVEEVGHELADDLAAEIGLRCAPQYLDRDTVVGWLRTGFVKAWEVWEICVTEGASATARGVPIRKLSFFNQAVQAAIADNQRIEEGRLWNARDELLWHDLQRERDALGEVGDDHSGRALTRRLEDVIANERAMRALYARAKQPRPWKPAFFRTLAAFEAKAVEVDAWVAAGRPAPSEPTAEELARLNRETLNPFVRLALFGEPITPEAVAAFEALEASQAAARAMPDMGQPR